MDEMFDATSRAIAALKTCQVWLDSERHGMFAHQARGYYFLRPRATKTCHVCIPCGQSIYKMRVLYPKLTARCCCPYKK